ncbi:MAG: FAD-dependent oxidoreductase, partial [Myxococcota bacterium]|nr:FAD-dependent oxidoreductase [Myxococcota bacterium]
MSQGADVVVVGAGLSGLTAAVALQSSGYEVRVLEARDRVGGRTLAQEIDGHVVDLGGQWLGPTQERVAALAEELGIETFPTWNEGTKVIEIDGRVSTYESDIPSLSWVNLAELQLTLTRLNRMSRRVNLDAPHLTPGAERLDQDTVAAWR